MKKIKWINILKTVLLIICLSVIFHDTYMLTIHTFITGEIYGLTLFGIVTFLLCGSISIDIIKDITRTINEPAPRHSKKRFISRRN